MSDLIVSVVGGYTQGSPFLVGLVIDAEGKRHLIAVNASKVLMHNVTLTKDGENAILSVADEEGTIVRDYGKEEFEAEVSEDFRLEDILRT